VLVIDDATKKFAAPGTL